MSDLRKSARGQECALRLPGICNGNPETTVLCHATPGGMGMKCPDTTAFYGCSACHAVYDRHDSRWMEFGREHLAAQALRAVGETHLRMKQAGVLDVE